MASLRNLVISLHRLSVAPPTSLPRYDITPATPPTLQLLMIN
jgi:hypothetical protein